MASRCRAVSSAASAAWHAAGAACNNCCLRFFVHAANFFHVAYECKNIVGVSKADKGLHIEGGAAA